MNTFSKNFIAIVSALLLTGLLYLLGPVEINVQPKQSEQTVSKEDLAEGVELPISWGNLGAMLVESGVIDKTKFESLYAQRGGISEESLALLEENNTGAVVINSYNAGLILNLLWAFGLSNKNPILEEGPMADPQYGGAGRFASTGGWTLSKGGAMDHYSAHSFVTLTKEQQALVEKVAKNIYRPCCDNSTYFPDCNHGMAMLGLLELMAAQNISEEEMYKNALAVQSYWFPDTYQNISLYLQKYGKVNVSPKDILGYTYSSVSGYRNVLSAIEPIETKSSGCGV